MDVLQPMSAVSVNNCSLPEAAIRQSPEEDSEKQPELSNHTIVYEVSDALAQAEQTSRTSSACVCL